MLASWRGTRFECVQVLREVCDKVLKDPEVSEAVLVNRAKVLFSCLVNRWGAPHYCPLVMFRVYFCSAPSSRVHGQMSPMLSDESSNEWSPKPLLESLNIRR